MNILLKYINNLYDILIDKCPNDEETLIKTHTRYLEKLGDISFPVPLKNWYHLTSIRSNNNSDTIFSYKLTQNEVKNALETLKDALNSLHTKIVNCKIIKNNAHLFLERTILFEFGIKAAINEEDMYGKWMELTSKFNIIVETELEKPIEHLDLTTLRMRILKKVIENLLVLTTRPEADNMEQLTISKTAKNELPNLLCGPVINEQGVKDTTHSAADFFTKRKTDMLLTAQHRYRVSVKSTAQWNDFFTKLGRASVTIELLSNKPHKPIKITLNDLSGPNKGASFIFYNCARLSILLGEFEKKVDKGQYPSLPQCDKIDFTLLKQPEEWELLYVYILQFPFVVKNCIRGIQNGSVNPQHLITFLSNLSSVFSIYYRRVRILTDPRDHMIGLIHARIYLLKALRYVFYNALRIMNIDPIKEM